MLAKYIVIPRHTEGMAYIALKRPRITWGEAIGFIASGVAVLAVVALAGCKPADGATVERCGITRHEHDGAAEYRAVIGGAEYASRDKATLAFAVESMDRGCNGAKYK